MVLTLLLLCGISRKKCHWVLDVIRFVFTSLESKIGISVRIPSDSRSLLCHFDIDPELIRYFSGPRCYALYPDDPSCPDRCQFQPYSTAPICHTELFVTRELKGGTHTMATRKYLHQSFKAWHARLLARKDIEASLDEYCKQCRSAPRDTHGRIRDIMESKVVQTFLGKDGSKFLAGPDDELRLVWGFAFASGKTLLRA